MSPFILSQILIGIATCSDLLSFQLKKRTHIVLCLSISATLFSLHFILLEKWTAAVLMLIAAVRFITSYFSTSKKLMLIFASASILSVFVTFQGLLSILSGLATLFHTFGSFSRDDKHLRQLMIVGTLFWICHNFLAHSPAAVLVEILFLGSNLIGYYRFYIKNNIYT